MKILVKIFQILGKILIFMALGLVCLLLAMAFPDAAVVVVSGLIVLSGVCPILMVILGSYLYHKVIKVLDKGDEAEIKALNLSENFLEIFKERSAYIRRIYSNRWLVVFLSLVLIFMGVGFGFFLDYTATFIPK